MKILFLNYYWHFESESELFGSFVQFLLFDFQYQINSFFKCRDDHRRWVLVIIVGSCMDSCLSQKGYPTDLIRPFDVCSWVVSKHEIAAFPIPFFHEVSYELKGHFLWLSEVKFVQLETVSWAVVLKHVIKRTEGYSGSMVASSPCNIVLGCKIWRQRKFSVGFL